MSNIKVKLPSGAQLEIFLESTPFRTSKALYQAFIEDTKDISVTSKSDLVGIFRAVVLSSISSKKVEPYLWECMKFATYNELKVDESTFEPISAREDFPVVCLEVAHANVYPFLKNLPAQFNLLWEKLLASQK